MVAQYCYGEPSEVAEDCLDICTGENQGWCTGPGERSFKGACPVPEPDVGSCQYEGTRDEDLPNVTSCWEIWGFQPTEETVTTPPPDYRDDLQRSCEKEGHAWKDAPCPRPSDTLGQCTYDATAFSPPNTWVFSGTAEEDTLPCGGRWCTTPLKP